MPVVRIAFVRNENGKAALVKEFVAKNADGSYPLHGGLSIRRASRPALIRNAAPLRSRECAADLLTSTPGRSWWRLSPHYAAGELAAEL
jgi:hypothetical protein